MRPIDQTELVWTEVKKNFLVMAPLFSSVNVVSCRVAGTHRQNIFLFFRILRFFHFLYFFLILIFLV